MNAHSNVNATEGYLFSSLLSSRLMASMRPLKATWMSRVRVLTEKVVLATVFSSGRSVCHLSVCRVRTFKQARNCEGQRINLYHSEYKVTLSVSLWLSLQNNTETIVICVPYFGLCKLSRKHGKMAKSNFTSSLTKALSLQGTGLIYLFILLFLTGILDSVAVFLVINLDHIPSGSTCP